MIFCDGLIKVAPYTKKHWLLDAPKGFIFPKYVEAKNATTI
jgi:hypothetical protein